MCKKILITGASRGLGLYMTKKYLEDGEMVFAGARDIDALQIKVLREKYPNTLIPIVLEVTDTKSVNEATTLVRQYTETIDMIINNAAIHSETSWHAMEEADIDECLQVYDVNSLGPLRVVKAFLSLLRKSSQGKIINISSESGSIETCEREKEFDYCMSKAALGINTIETPIFIDQTGKQFPW